MIRYDLISMIITPFGTEFNEVLNMALIWWLLSIVLLLATARRRLYLWDPGHRRASAHRIGHWRASSCNRWCSWWNSSSKYTTSQYVCEWGWYSLARWYTPELRRKQEHYIVSWRSLRSLRWWERKMLRRLKDGTFSDPNGNDRKKYQGGVSLSYLND